MISYWGICIWVISNGYARYTDRTEQTAQLIGNVEPGNVLLQDGDDLRRLSENGVMRRRVTQHTGSANAFHCYGSNTGTWAPFYNFHQRPFGAVVRYENTIGSLRFYYTLESTGKSYFVGGGINGGKHMYLHFGALPSGCVDRVDFRLGFESGKGYTLNGITFHGGKKYFNWSGGLKGLYYTVKAPSDRCLGDVRMRTGHQGVNYLCLRFNAYTCKSCSTYHRTNCDKYGRKPPQCVLEKCPSGYYLSISGSRSCNRCRTCPYGSYQRFACSGLTNTFCSRCSRCTSGFYVTSACSRTRDTVCAQYKTCYHGYYRTSYNRCRRCTRCRSGWILVSRCTETRDAVCRYCTWCRTPSLLDYL